MSLLLNITEETDNCDPMEGLEGERGEEAEADEEEELEEWKAKVCYPSMEVNQVVGEEMM